MNVQTMTTAQLLQTIEEIDFTKFRIAELIDLARTHFNLQLPKSWNKNEIINALLQAADGADLSMYAIKTVGAATAKSELFDDSADIIPTADVPVAGNEQLTGISLDDLTSGPVVFATAQDFIDATDPDPNSTPLSAHAQILLSAAPQPTLDAPIGPAPMTKEEVAAKIAEHKQTVADMQAEAEESKPKKMPASKTYTLDQLVKFSDEIGYAIGALRWALGRIEKIEKKFPDLIDGLGEMIDADAVAMANEAMVVGYKRSHRQMRFVSPAHENTLKQSDLPGAIIDEISTYRPENAVTQLSLWVQNNVE